ncbi:S1/P1 nuclease [Protomyces lactucae-debilis]|uniref:S1/P1 nuclease n=1 Tax=Protomyces lactucae-debilis TaxID=2754530 RepID=A0A1Y2FUM4_PROLT|nr:S1/P1 nuclease [Protomyces lactucae-debilis]ORY86405.1 S1/P1 nuclease [Protomyces lactucae-debilis]
MQLPARFISLSLLLSAPALVYGWSWTGHELIADIAQDFLTPNASAKISEMLGGRPLSSIAAWADTIHWMPRYQFSGRLHYFDYEGVNPPESCRFEWHAPGGQEVIAAVHNYTARLIDAEDGTWTQQESLRFLVHFIEDTHQPLHLCGRARGGNDYFVKFENRKAKLHQVWDGLALMKRMKQVYASRHALQLQQQLADEQDNDVQASDDYVHQLTAVYKHYILQLMQETLYASQHKTWLLCPSNTVNPQYGCPEIWSKETAQLNCDYVWRDALEWPQVSPDAYWERIERDAVIEVQVMKASWRLAAILNAVFETMLA